MTEKSGNWSREQLLVAFNLYCCLPFGKLHSKNPEIIRYAKLIGRTPSALAMKLTNIASLDPVITESGRTGLLGASKIDKAMWSEMQHDWEEFALESQKAIDLLGQAPELRAELISEQYSIAAEESISYSAENKFSITQVRIGQQFFRQSVISAYRGRCCITGLTDARLLIASHIVPWREDKQNRLNPRNGLCLSALHDKAFDQGLFTLTSDFRVKISREMTTLTKNRFAEEWLIGLNDKQIELPEKFQPMSEFIDWHRQNIYRDR